MRILLLACTWAIAGCHVGLLALASSAPDAQGPYLAGTLARELGPPAVRTLGCLDVAVTPITRRGEDLLRLHVGNRCTHPEALDLAKLRMVAEDAEGRRLDPTLEDPRREIVRLHVGGSERGHELVRVLGLTRASRVCFAMEAIAPDAPEAVPSATCFARSRDGWLTVEGST